MAFLFFGSPFLSSAGFAGAKASQWALNHAKLEFEGLYPALSVALLVLTYGVTQALGGSDFLAVYVSGIVLGNAIYVHKLSLNAFHDGLAWLMQIVMFLLMGLLIVPGELLPIAWSGIALAAFLVLVARPISVLVCLTPFRFSWREQAMVSWGGLRGAVPIVLATYPLIAGAPGARTIFNLVFFVVFTSVLLQATTLSLVAKWLNVEAPLVSDLRFPIQHNPTRSLGEELVEIPVPAGSAAAGRTLADLALPTGAVIVLIRRGDEMFVPHGTSQIEASDTLLVLAERDALARVHARVRRT
jgi:potassium/hydrogen antiporter